MDRSIAKLIDKYIDSKPPTAPEVDAQLDAYIVRLTKEL